VDAAVYHGGRSVTFRPLTLGGTIARSWQGIGVSTKAGQPRKNSRADGRATRRPAIFVFADEARANNAFRIVSPMARYFRVDPLARWNKPRT